MNPDPTTRFRELLVSSIYLIVVCFTLAAEDVTE